VEIKKRPVNKFGKWENSHSPSHSQKTRMSGAPGFRGPPAYFYLVAAVDF